MNKNYYTFEELDNMEEQLIDLVGFPRLYQALSQWLGYEMLGEFMKDYCRDHDIQVDEEVGENEE